MIELQDIAEILLVEDNPNDVELTIRAQLPHLNNPFKAS
jgi:hypothetical protein